MMIQLTNGTKIYTMGGREVRALNGVRLGLNRGEMVVSVGPSGSGRSTVMNTLPVLDLPIAGIDVATFTGTELAEIRPDGRAR